MEVSTYEMHASGSLEGEAMQNLAAQASSFASQAPDGTTLTLMRDEDSKMRAFISVPGSQDRTKNVAFNLGHPTKSKALYIEGGLSLAERSKVARVTVPNNSSYGSAVLAGATPDVLVRTMIGNLQPGQWVALSMRTPSRAEVKRNKLVQDHRGKMQHQSRAMNAKVCAVYAGADSQDVADRLAEQVVAGFPGLEVAAKSTAAPGRIASAAKLWMVAAIAGVLAFAGPLAYSYVAEFSMLDVREVPPLVSVFLYVLAVVLALLGALQLTGHVPSEASRREALMGHGLVPIAAKRAKAPSRPSREREEVDNAGNRKLIQESEGDYPLAKDAILLSPAVMVMLVTPHGSNEFASNIAADGRSAPAALKKPVGPLIAMEDDVPVHLTVEDAWAGAFLVGQAGSGKTYMMELIWAWWVMSMNRDGGSVPLPLAQLWKEAPSSIPSFQAPVFQIPTMPEAPARRALPNAPATDAAAVPSFEAPAFAPSSFGPAADWSEDPMLDREAYEAGLRFAAKARDTIDALPLMSTMIAFDNKGDRKLTESLIRWTRKLGIEAVVIDFAEVGDDVGIDIFPAPKLNDPNSEGPRRFAENVVDGLTYAYGADAIGNQSGPSLVSVFTAASVLKQFEAQLVPDAAAEVRGGSVWAYANVLIGNRGDELGQTLADGIFQAASTPGAHPWITEAAGALATIYQGMTPAKRRDLFSAPRNKIEPLTSLESWWSRPAMLSWEEVLNSGRPFILNFGQTPSRRTLSDKIVDKVSAFVLYSLRKAILLNCGGWQEERKAVVLFADEVKHLASETNDTILTWFRADGRAFGVVCYFATQEPNQMSVNVRSSMLGYNTVAVFSQGDSGVQEEVARRVSSQTQLWTANEIEQLPRYTCVVKTRIRQESVPGFYAKAPELHNEPIETFVQLALVDRSAA